MLVFGGDIRTSLVIFVRGTMPRCTHCTKFLGLIKNVYKMVSHNLWLVKRRLIATTSGQV
jgi:hypothetical protein